MSKSRRKNYFPDSDEMSNTNYTFMEKTIELRVQKEYFGMKERLSAESSLLEDLIFRFENEARTIYEKKRILCKIVNVDSIQSFRFLEKYVNSPDQGLEDWSVMAFTEAKMKMLGNLTEQNQVLVSSGLGGNGSLLRFFCVFFPFKRNYFFENDIKNIKNEIDFFVSKFGLKVEWIENFHLEFFKFMILFPINYEMDSFIWKILDSCSEIGLLIEPWYILTNIKEMTDIEINDLRNGGDMMDKYVEQNL